MSEKNVNKNGEFIKEFVMSLFHRKIIVKDDMSVDVQKFMEEYDDAIKNENLDCKATDADSMCVLLRKAGFQPLSIDSDRNVFVFPEAVILKEHSRMFNVMDAMQLNPIKEIEAWGAQIEKLEFWGEKNFSCKGLRKIPAKWELKKVAKFSCKLCIKIFPKKENLIEHIEYHNKIDDKSGILKELHECHYCNFGLILSKNISKSILRMTLSSKNSRDVLVVDNIILITKSQLYEIKSVELPKKLDPFAELKFYLHEMEIDEFMDKAMPICVSFSIPSKNIKGFVQFCYYDDELPVISEAVILKEHSRMFNVMDAMQLNPIKEIEAWGAQIEKLEFRGEKDFSCKGLRKIPAKWELKKGAKFSCKLCINIFPKKENLIKHIEYHNKIDDKSGILKELRECHYCNFGLIFSKNISKSILRMTLSSKNSRDVLVVDNIILITKSQLYEIKSVELPKKLDPFAELKFYLHEMEIDEFMDKAMPICVSFSIPSKNIKGFVQFCYYDDELPTISNRKPSNEGCLKRKIELDYSKCFPTALFSKKNFMEDIQRKEPVIDDYIKNNLKLTPQNYKKVLQLLVQLEFYEEIKVYKKLSVCNVRLTEIKENYKSKSQLYIKNFYQVEIELKERDLFVSDVLQAGDSVEIRKFIPKKEMIRTTRNETISGTVVKLRKNVVYISSPQQLNGAYNLKFSPGLCMYDCQMHALDKISKWDTSIFMMKLFPSEENLKENSVDFDLQQEFPVFNQSIKGNEEQLKAVKDICKETCVSHIPYIIFGPPGTGKTTTIVEAVAQLYFQGNSQKRILIAMGANNAADDIALRLLKLLCTKEESPKLMRIYAASKEKDKISIDPLLLQYSNLHNNHYYPSIGYAHSTPRIVVCTCHVVGIMATGGFGGGGGVFSHVIIDEAAAVTEADILVVLAAAVNSKTKVILAGDHKQLGPVLQSKPAAGYNFNKSMMERLCELPVYSKNNQMKTSLRQNYRTHPDIVEIYNKLFYEGQLIAVCHAAERNMVERWYLTKKDCRYPVIFHDIRGTAVNGRNGCSLSNNAEIKIVLKYVSELMYFGIDGQPLEEEQIGVISPYKRQYLDIKKTFVARRWYNLKTSSVESFQGQEREAIIVSFARTDRKTIGFLNSFQRLNVALSRPKSLLILIGDASYLATKSHLFHHIIKGCQENGTLVNKFN